MIADDVSQFHITLAESSCFATEANKLAGGFPEQD